MPRRTKTPGRRVGDAARTRGEILAALATARQTGDTNVVPRAAELLRMYRSGLYARAERDPVIAAAIAGQRVAVEPCASCGGTGERRRN